jgi:diguanylate cyclase
MKVPFPSNEAERLAALYQYNILDTAPEQVFDDLTLLAAHICDTPIALITFLDAERQWFKSKVGLTLTEISRELALCNYTILEAGELFVVPDTLADERFATHPLVTSEPEIRFYAGVPLVTDKGYALGTLCVLDHKPRHLTVDQIAVLQALRRAIITEVQMRRNVEILAWTLTERDQAYVVLQELKDELELEVQAQTAELQAVNEQLQLELTERMRAEEALAASEERFQLAMQSAIDAIIIADKAGLIVSWNMGAQTMFGYTEVEVIGQPITLLMPQPFRERHQAGFLRYNLTGQKKLIGQTVELQGRRKDGGIFPLELSLSVRSIRKEPFFSGIIRDITERKQAEAQIRQNAARAEALARIAARLNAQLDLETVLNTVCEEAARALNVSAVVRLYNAQRDELYYASSVGCLWTTRGWHSPGPGRIMRGS